MKINKMVALFGAIVFCVGTPSLAGARGHDYPDNKDAKALETLIAETHHGRALDTTFAAKKNRDNIPKRVPHTIIVKYKTADVAQAPSRAALQMQTLEEKHRVVAKRPVFADPSTSSAKKLTRSSSGTDLSLIYEITLGDDGDVESAVNDLRADGNIAYAFQSMVYHTDMLPNDPIFSSNDMGGLGAAHYPDLWGAHSMNMQPAWDITQGEGQVVAVVDTGLDYNHGDIWDNVWVNPDVVSDVNGDGVINLDDVDLNGNHRIEKNEIVDNMFGWDFTECKGFTRYGTCIAKAQDNDPYDDNGHGTHVSGTIAAVGNNSYGLIGIAPKAKVMPIKALTSQGYGFDAWLAKGIVYAVDHGATVINNSWGCDGCEVDPLLEDVVRYAHDSDVAVVFAAGNSNTDVKNSSPANMDEAIAVAACTPDDEAAFFSNYGTTIATCAPGGGTYDATSRKAFYKALYNVVSLRAQRGREIKSHLLNCVSDSHFVCLAGTSMASPHTAGEVALIRAHNPALNVDQIKWVLNASARDIGSPGFDLLTGPGIADAYRALQVNEVIAVGIDMPVEGTIFHRITDTINILGSVQGASLASYQLYYGEGRLPKEWHPILSGSSPVDHDYLGTWNIVAVNNGMYTIRLVATSTAGWQFQTITSIYLDDPPQRVNPTDDHQIYPTMNNGTLIWQARRNNHDDVRIHDFSTDVTRWWSGVDDGATRSPADVSQGVVVAEEWNANQHNWDLVEQDTAVGESSIVNVTNDDIDQYDFKIDGDTETWLACGRRSSLTSCFLSLNRYVFIRNRTTNTIEQITNALAPRIELRISKHLLLWSEWVGNLVSGTWRIRGYNMQTKQFFWLATPDASSDGEQRFAALDYPYVVWNEFAGAWRLRACNIDSCDNPWWVTSDSERCIYPQLSETKVVCESSLNWNWDIEMTDIVTLDRKMITADPTDQVNPTIDKVSGGWRVAWQDSRWVIWSGGQAYRIWQIASTVVPE